MVATYIAPVPSMAHMAHMAENRHERHDALSNPSYYYFCHLYLNFLPTPGLQSR